MGITLCQSSVISMSNSDVCLCALSATKDTAEADRPLSKARMASSFSDRSTAVGPLPTGFKPYLCRFTAAASNTVEEHSVVTTSRSRFL